MKKQEYMNQLSSALASFDKEITDEIIADYEEHFRMGALNGKSEEQIGEELGSTEELVAELNQLTGRADSRSTKAQSGNESSSQTENVKKEQVVIVDAVGRDVVHIEEKASEESSDNRAEKDISVKNDAASGDNTNSYGQQSTNGQGTDGDFNESGADGSFGQSYEYNESNNRNNGSDSFKDSFSREMNDMGNAIYKGVESLISGATKLAREVASGIDKATTSNGYTGSAGTETETEQAEYNTTENNQSEAGAFTQNEGAIPGDCDTIIIEGNCADIYVRYGGTNNISFDYRNHGSKNQQMAYRFYHYNEGRTIYAGIKRQETVSSFFGRIGSPTIELFITLPNNMKGVTIRTLSGEIIFSGVNLGNLELSALSGDIKLTDVCADKISISTTSGDTDVNRVKARIISAGASSGDICTTEINCEKFKANTASGSIRITRSKVAASDVRTASGDINIEYIEGESLGTEAASGDVRVDAAVRSYTGRNASGDIDYKNTGDVVASIQTVSGDLTVRLNNQGHGYNAEVRTVSGDISLGYKGEQRYGIRRGNYTLGEGSSRLNLSTVSGDMNVNA